MSDKDRRNNEVEGYKEAFRGVARKYGDSFARESARHLIDQVATSKDPSQLDKVLEAIEDLDDEKPPQRR